MRRSLLVTALLTAVVLLPSGPAGAQAEAGPALETDPATLDAALACPPTFEHPDRDPVLLVHGTATTSEESWPWSLGAVLPAAGYDVCTVDLPGRALVDQQTSAEYVVHAVRAMAARLAAAGSDSQVDIIGHSQGTLEPRWALRWWPDVRASTDELVQLAPPNQGTSSAQGVCSLGQCPPAVWQMVPGSAYLTALNTDDPVPAEVDVTAVVSLFDDLVQPAPAASALPGAEVIVIQDLCPARYVGHVQLLADAVAVSLVLDALGNDGPADRARFDPATCLQLTAPGTDPVAVTLGSASVYANGALALTSAPMVDAEPALQSYALPAGSAAEPAPSTPTAGEESSGADTGGASIGGASSPTLPATGGGALPALALVAAVAGLALAVLRGRGA